jgi:hypothetical protein
MKDFIVSPYKHKIESDADIARIQDLSQPGIRQVLVDFDTTFTLALLNSKSFYYKLFAYRLFRNYV